MASLRRRILGSIGALLLLVIAGFFYMLGHESPCESVPGPAAGTPTMKAVVRRCYGPPDVLAIEDIEKPSPTDGRVLVKVRAASVNPVDWHFMRATPYLIRMESGFGAPKNPRIGTDFAGTVEAVGKGVTRFKPGDEVFGGANGALRPIRDDRGGGQSGPETRGHQLRAGSRRQRGGTHGATDAT